MKSDTGKPQWWLLRGIYSSVDCVIRVREWSLKDHPDPDDWMLLPDGRRKFIDAAIRHCVLVHEGEDINPESGLPHLAHALLDLMFALALRP